MDWSNEIYVKVYVRDTDDDLALSWEARALWDRLMKKFDRSGLLATKRGSRGVTAASLMPLEVVERALPELLADGRLVEVEGGYFAPNFLAAQEAIKSDKLRQREARERRRAGVQPRNASVTPRDATVTDVTLCLTDPKQSESSRARAIPPPPTTKPEDPQHEHGRAEPARPDQIKAQAALVSWAMGEIDAIRARVASRFGWTDVRPLHPMDAGRGHLLERIAEDPARAADNVRHVLAVAEAEAISKKTVEWLTGAMFKFESWRKKLGMRVEDARKAPTAHGPQSAPTMRIVGRDEEEPPPMPMAGGKP